MRTAAALILIFATSATCHAGWFNSWGRHLGLGWSDGYHAIGQCPPQNGNHFAIPPGGLAHPEPIPVPARQPTPATPPLLFELPR